MGETGIKQVIHYVTVRIVIRVGKDTVCREHMKLGLGVLREARG